MKHIGDTVHPFGSVWSMFYDSANANGIVYLKKEIRSWSVCNTKEKELYKANCKILTESSTSNVATLTPFGGYNAQSYPFLLLRTERLYVIDTQSMGIYQFNTNDYGMKRSSSSSRYANTVAVSQNTLVGIGQESSIGGNSNFPVNKYVLTDDAFNKLKTFHHV